MGVLALIDCYVEINSVDMSDHTTGVELNLEGVDLTTTNFGSEGWDERISGLKSATVTVGFNQDYDATTVDDRLWARFGLVTAMEIRPTAAAIGATNPSFNFDVVVLELQPVAGTVGDLAVMSLTWPVTGAVARATS